MRKEIRSLTGIRGIAAFYVVLYHLTKGRVVFLYNGYLAVDLFFILSGFIMCYVYEREFSEGALVFNIKKFWAHRFARIYPAYIFWFIVFVVFSKYILAHMEIGRLNFAVCLTLFQSIGFVKGVPNASWSVSVEFALYIIFPLILILTRSKWFIAVLFCCAFSILLYLTSDPSSYVVGPAKGMSGALDIYRTTTMGPLLRGFSGFSLGVVAFHIAPIFEKMKTRFVKWVQSIIVFLMMLSLYFKGFDLEFVILVFILIPILYREIGFLNRCLGSDPVYFLGKISYSIYISHKLMLWIFDRISRLYFPKIGFLGEFLYSIIWIGLIVFVAYLSYIFIERPMRRLLNSIFDRKVRGSGLEVDA